MFELLGASHFKEGLRPLGARVGRMDSELHLGYPACLRPRLWLSCLAETALSGLHSGSAFLLATLAFRMS